MNGYFITGTGTGVGKTFVTSAIARQARALGKRVFAFKPIETGCARVDGRLVGSDQTILCEAAGNWQTGALRGVYQFEVPVAPSVAAESPIDLERIAAVMHEGMGHADLTLVEGAGGWRVPINDTADMAELARRLGLPVIIVGSAGLGTINHSLLTIEAVERKCPIAGLVLSRRAEDDPTLLGSNIREIRKRWSGRITVSDHLDCFT